MTQIIHISDFHLDSNQNQLKKEQIVSALIQDLKAQKIDTNNCLIILSGDLIDKGGCKFECIDAAFSMFQSIFTDKIIEGLNIKKEQFFFVPGNHDVDRKKIDGIIESGIACNLSSPEKIDEFIYNNRHNSKYLERILSFKKFEENYYSDAIKKQLSFFDSCFITSNNIGIACLNSSWRSSKDSENGTLIVGKSQVESAVEFVKNTNVKIAVMHHSISDLTEDDRNNIKPLLFSNFDILLTGHKHTLDMEYTKSFQGSLLSCQSNASIADFSNEKYTNGYSIIEFEKGEKTIIKYRKYVYSCSKFVSNTDIGTDDGCIEIDYPNEGQIEENRIVNKALQNIQNSKFEEIDEHLFTHGIDSNIPCRINDLFVEPILSNMPETHGDNSGVKYYHLTDLMSSSDNFLIYGLKESGKTTLLDKLLVEFTCNYKSFNVLPVSLNFTEIGTYTDIAKIIRKYLSVSKDEYQTLITSKQKIVLIIDNIFFDNHEKIKKLTDFIQTTPCCRIIASKEQVLESVLPNDFLEYNADFDFSLIYIQNFKSQQIKSLIKKWFPEKTDDYKSRINRLIKNFEVLALPRTPLAVTLFLWIIDKQERTPVNNSLLVEMVVENLLEKTHFENIYQNKFTYQNKIRLLSFIAKKMEDDGDENYSYRLKESDLIDFIKEYLKGKSDVPPKKMIDDFVQRSIFIYSDEEFIKFKFDFFFRYFLALHIGYNKDFKQLIFNKDNCLSYMDEIIYYSGLHTDCNELLVLSQELLQNTYFEYNKDLINNPNQIDQFLNTRKSLSENIAMTQIQKKPTEADLDKIYDDELSNIPIKKSIEKRQNVKTQPIDKVLKFSAALFRNLEEIDNITDRKNALQQIITSSISFLLIYRVSLIKYCATNQKTPNGFPKNIDIKLFIRLLPLLHQVLMSDWLITEKNKLLFKEKIDNHNLNLSVSEYEKFLDIFIYADIKGKDSMDIFKRFLTDNKYRYIKDLGVIKLILYYYMRSKSKDSDKFYLNLISDLKIKLKQTNDKGKCIRQLQEGKNKEDRNN